VAQESDLGREALAVFEIDARAPCCQVLVRHEAAYLDDVRLRYGAPRVQQSFREVAVVGGEQDAARRVIEAPYGIDPTWSVFQVVTYGKTPFRIGHRRDHPSGLMENQVDEILGEDAFSVDLDPIAARIRTHPQLGRHATVDPYAPGGDELLGVATRGYACASQHLLETDVSGLRSCRLRGGGGRPGYGHQPCGCSRSIPGCVFSPGSCRGFAVLCDPSRPANERRASFL